MRPRSRTGTATGCRRLAWALSSSFSCPRVDDTLKGRCLSSPVSRRAPHNRIVLRSMGRFPARTAMAELSVNEIASLQAHTRHSGRAPPSGKRKRP